jgi:signal peptide peptidase SppA
MQTMMMHALARVAVWAMHRPTLARLMRVARAGWGEQAQPMSPETTGMSAAALGVWAGLPIPSDAPPPPTVAVIPIRGVIEPRRSYWTEIGFGTSLEGLRAMLRKALADESVKGIVFDITSPGGDAAGVEEFAAEVFKSRGQKPIIAVVNGLAASAAYWIAAQADEIVGLQAAGACGGVGVYSMHEDISRWLDENGITITFIQAGDYKTEGNSYEPLTDEAREFYQSQVDAINTRFVGAVAKGRGVTVAKVKADFGQGRCYLMPEAVKAGMADRMVASFDEVIARAASGRPIRRAEATPPTIEASASEGATVDDTMAHDTPAVFDQVANAAGARRAPLEVETAGVSANGPTAESDAVAIAAVLSSEV